MTKAKHTSRALLASALALILCVSMLISTTFAWFTDSAASYGNIITAGELDIAMYWTDDLDSGVWYDVEDDAHNTVFSYDNWEPGYTDVKYIKLVNNGNLAFNYKLTLTPQNGVGKLAEVINVHFADHEVEVKEREDLSDLRSIGLLNSVLNGGATASGTLLATGQQSDLHPAGEIVMTLAMTMITTAGNEYMEEESGDFTITALATQAAVEKDSFGSNYDGNATYPQLINGNTITATFDPENGLVPADGVTMQGEEVSAFAPAGVLLETGVDRLTLSVKPLQNTTSDITVVNDEILIPVDVHIDGVAENNTTPIIVDLGAVLPKYLNMGNYHLYHVENGENAVMTLVSNRDALTAHNTFTYDPMTGAVSVAMATFSEVALVADTSCVWESKIATAFGGGSGTATDPYLIANADQFAYLNECISNNSQYADKHYKLLSDINIDGADDGAKFYPIGYHKVLESAAAIGLDDAPAATYEVSEETVVKPAVSAVSTDDTYYTYGGAFRGVFDGNGHTISNIYQNTWAMKGDYDGHYWNDAMGVFGYVFGGTIKNLTVDNFESDGEFTPTGVVAAYAANATFENIAITNCNPRVYNTGNGGIVGIGGRTDASGEKMFFKNITVDNTNKISALWGSWDVACGGLMGMLRGNINGNTVDFNNCHVAAQIDVYNDVCGNYQYYAYRYAGMIIGSVRHNTKDENGKTIPDMVGISAKDCTVNFGNWNKYYYCELVSNTLASYTHDHQFSRLQEIESVKDIQDDKGNWNTTGNFAIIRRNPQDDSKVEEAECFHIVKDSDGNIVRHLHEDAGKETVGGKEVWKEDNRIVYLPFTQLFTGYSWGVSNIGLKNYGGILSDGAVVESEKFASKVKFSAIGEDTFETETTVLVGDLFKEDLADVNYPIKGDSVQVFVSPVGDNSTVNATYVANTEDWTQGTLTFAGTGAAQITITDYYYCEATTKDVTITEISDKEKFVTNFTGDFLYRVGNKNSVSLGTLFAAKGGATINTANVSVSAETKTGNASVVYTANASDWTKGTLQFSGTGVVTLVITDNTHCVEVQLHLEVVDATNLTSAIGTTTGGTFVLLCDVNTSTYVNYWDCTLYGNGFTYSLKGAPTAYNSKQGHGVIITKNATLDNVQIIGDVYNAYGAYTNQDYYNAAVDAMGDTIIQNSYIANCAAPVKARSNVTIKNTTLYGGTVANLLIVSGTATLEDVTTANYDDGRALVGMGIVIHSDATETAKLVLNGTLTQYNFINESKVPSDTYAKNLHSAMFKDDCSKYHFGTSPNRYVNTGIISLSAIFNDAGITDNAKTGYAGQKLTVSANDGYVYTQLNTNGAVNNNFTEYKPTTQGAVPPAYSFDYTNKNYIAKTEGSNDYCYEENGVVNISMDEGDTFNWDTSILTLGKGVGNYTVKMNGTDYTGKSIAFNTAGDYEVTYTYTDGNNNAIDENGNLTTYSATYTKTVNITVAVVKATTKHAEFTFGSSNTASTTVTIGNNTYVMPNVSGTNGTIGSTTVNGQTIYYPIVEIIMSDGKTSHTSGWYAYFPVFSGAVGIKDYADGGTGTAVTYGGQTTTMPSGLSIVGDPTSLFKYQSSSAAGSAPTVKNDILKNDILVYSSPKIEAKRNEYNTVVQYSYTDNAGATFYYYIGYHAPAQSYSSICVAPDTLVTMADGSKKQIKDVRVGDMVVAWDFATGTYVTRPVSLLQAHNTGLMDVLYLHFEDGTTLKVLGEHGVFDADLNTFIFIDQNDAKDYVGHEFVKAEGDGFKTVKLVDYEVVAEYTTAYTILSTEHYNVMLEDMFTVTPAHVGDNFFNPFDIGDDMKYTEAKVKEDIAKYGLYTYDDFKHVVTYDQFVALNLAQFKVSVEKGYVTYEGLIYLIEVFVNNADYDVQ